jgi:uncharacterized protein
VAVAARDRDRQETLRRLASRQDALRALLDSYATAIERRETSGMYVRPETKRSGEKISAYSGSVRTTVTVNDFGVLGELILRVADQDQVTLAGPWWEVRPGSPVYAAARRAAIEDAIGRAREYADALGARIIGLEQLSDSGLSTMAVPLSYGVKDARAFAAAEPELELDPQRQQIRASVEARFRISDPTVL